MSDELLRAAEELADAVENHLEDGNPGFFPPTRAEFAAGQEGDQEFKQERELYLESREHTKDTLERALFRYRRVEERATCQRATANSSSRNGTAAAANPKPKQRANRASKGATK
jgi:hypothetical protein